MPQTLALTVKDGIATLLINRPEVRNALDSNTIEQLAATVISIGLDPKVKAIILGGTGKVFSSGADLRSDAWSLPENLSRIAGVFHQAVLEIRHTSKPYIAAVEGVAAGAGFALSLACDFRVLSETAILRQVYTSHGLCMDGGSTFMLPRLLGHARALEIAAFDEPIPAARALEWGLATKVVPEGHTMDMAVEMARTLLSRSLYSFSRVKKLLGRSFESPLESQLEHERHAVCACAQHPDGAEGMRAFLEKRKPQFNNG